MNNLPMYVTALFAATTLLTVWFFYTAAGKRVGLLLVLFTWMAIQAIIALSGFYTITHTLPPGFLLLVLPPLLLIAVLLSTRPGKKFTGSLNIKTLTLLHIIRLPVEITLLLLFTYKKIPQLMTFEGRNFDILSGISAPFIFYLVFVKKTAGKKLLLWWNIICLALLLNIVINAVLSAPFPFQQFAFDQPNTAVLYFPFNWLPGVVVPLVLFAHLVVLQRLQKEDLNF